MNKNYLFLLTLLCINFFAKSQEFIYSSQVSTTTNDDMSSITSDDSGNIYVSGHSSSSFLKKYDNLGNLVFSRDITNVSGTANSEAKNAKLDSSNNIITVGSFRETCDFDPSATSNFTLSSVTASFGPTWDIFIQKLDSNGDFLWAKRIGGNSAARDTAFSLTTDSNDNIYITGYFRGTVDFDSSSSGVFTLTSASGEDNAFILKLDANGDFVWARKINSTRDSRGTSIDIDSNGNIFTTGFFGGTLNDGQDMFTALQSRDSFITKHDSNGNLIWTKAFGGEPTALAIDSSNNLLLTGLYRATVDLDPSTTATSMHTSNGVTDIFVLKLDNDGSFVWDLGIGQNGFDDSFSVSLDSFGSVYITGNFFGTVDFDPSVNTNALTSIATNINSGGDIYVAKYDSLGEYQWAYRPDRTVGGTNQGVAINVDTNFNIYAIGLFTGTHNFDFFGGTSELTSGGSYDGYILGMSQPTLSTPDFTNNSISTKIFPNPSNSDFTIELNSIQETLDIEVFDTNGRLIMKKSAINATNISFGTNLKSGVYFAKVKNSNKTFKFIKI